MNTDSTGPQANDPITDQPPRRYRQDVASPARVHDYFLRGKDNYLPDERAATDILRSVPCAAREVRETRAFRNRAISYLAHEKGVRQFLDLGVGMPASQHNVHQIAQDAAAEAHVVYVDIDAIVVAHACASMISTPAGRVRVVEADFTDVNRLIADPGFQILDLGSPVAISATAVADFLSDETGVYEAVRALVDHVAPGSFLVMTHTTADCDIPTVAALVEAYRGCGLSLIPRSRDEFAHFFAGLELVGPGIVPPNRWWPNEVGSPDDAGVAMRRIGGADVNCWAAVGRVG